MALFLMELGTLEPRGAARAEGTALGGVCARCAGGHRWEGQSGGGLLPGFLLRLCLCFRCVFYSV